MSKLNVSTLIELRKADINEKDIDWVESQIPDNITEKELALVNTTIEFMTELLVDEIAELEMIHEDEMDELEIMYGK